MNYFYTVLDGGFISKVFRDSLTKSPQRTGTRGYRPSDLDLAARTRFVLDLISRVGFRSGSSGRKGVRAAAGLAGDVFPRWGFTGASQSRSSRLGSGLGLAWEHERGMGNPPGHSGQKDPGSDRARGGAGRRYLAGERCPGT